MKPQRPLVIGIVGPIGSGKTTVAGQFEQLGAKRIDADEIAHQVLERPEVIGLVERAFGRAVLDANGLVNRKALAEVVFEDGGALRRLNDILHPRVKRLIEDRIDTAVRAKDATSIVLDAALLVEAGMTSMCDTIIYVDVGREEREKRVAMGRHWSLKELHRRERHQASDAEKLAAADIIINNSGTPQRTRQQVTDIWNGLVR